MKQRIAKMPKAGQTAFLFFLIFTIGCAKVYYGTMEKFGVHKRDILIDSVEDARDAQSDAQEQFKSALEQFSVVIQIIHDPGRRQRVYF